MPDCSRRAVLQGGVVAALGLLAAPPSATAAPAEVLRTPLATLATGLPPWQPGGPLRWTWSANLSEDYYTSSDVLLDPARAGGYVAPIVRSDGTPVLVAAVGGAPTLVGPSTTSSSGYATTRLSGLPGGFQPVAATGPANTVLLCGFSIQNDLSVPYAATVGAQGAVTSSRQLGIQGGGSGYRVATSMSAAVDPTTGAARFVYAATADGQTWRLCLFDPGSGAQTSSVIPLPPGRSVDEGFFSAWGVSGQVLAAGLIGLDDGSLLFVRAALGQEVQAQPLVTSSGVAVSGNVFAGAVPLPVSPVAGGLVTLSWNDSADHTYLAVCNARGQLVTAPVPLLDNRPYGGSFGTTESVRWFFDDVSKLITVYLRGDDGTVYVQQVDFTQADPGGSPAVPLQTGVVEMHLPPPAPQQQTVLALTLPSPTGDLLDTTPVTLLARDTATAPWRLTPLKADAPQHAPMTTWRTLLSVTDSGGMPVPGQKLLITPTADVISYAPQGATLLPGNKQTAVLTDSHGQVCLASLATSLNATGMSVSLPGQIERLVAPDGELHDFLAGDGPMNQYASVTDAMQQNSAQLPNLPAGSVDQVAGAITAAMSCGQKPQTYDAANNFTLSGLSGSSPTLSRSPYRATLGSWWSHIEHDLESVAHAIAQGVAKVESVGSSWNAALSQWTMQLELRLANGVTSAISYAIKDLQSACTAVMGVLKALGADIMTAVDFLKTLVGEIVADAKAIAGVLYEWITVAPGRDTGLSHAINVLNQAESGLNFEFATLESRIASAMKSLQGTNAGTSGVSSYAHQKLPGPAGQAQSNTSGSSKANWLMQKTRTLDSSSAVGPPLSSGTVTAAKSTMTAAAASDLAASAHQVVADAPKVSSPTEAMGAVTVDWFAEVMLAVASDTLGFIDTVIDDVIDLLKQGIVDLSDLMTTSLAGTPIGDLLSVFGIGDLTLGQLICLLVGFGMAVAGDLVFAGQSWLPTSVSSTRTALSAPQPGALQATNVWADFLAVANAVVAFYSIPGTLVADNEYYSQDPEPSEWLGVINIGIEVLVNIVSFPFAASGDPQLEFTPKSNALATEIVTEICWVLGVVPLVIDIAAEKLVADDPLAQEIWNNDSALLGLICGVVLVAFNIIVAVLTAPTDPIGILTAFFAWAPLALKIFRLGGPENDGVCFISFAGDFLGPLAIIVLSLTSLAAA